MKPLFYLNKYIWKYKYRLLLGIVFIFLSNYFSLFPAEYVRKSLDEAIVSFDQYHQADNPVEKNLIKDRVFNAVSVYILMILLMTFLKGLFTFFTRQTIIIMSRLIEYDLKNAIYKHYQVLDMDFYRQNSTGDIMNRISEDLNRVRMYLGPGIMYSINLIALFIMVVSTMLSINVRLTLIALIPMPFLAVMIYFVSRQINRKSTIAQQSLSKIMQWAQETFSGIRIIKSMAKEKVFERIYKDASDDYRKKNIDLYKVEALFYPSMLIMIGLSTVFTVYFGGKQVFMGNLTYGNIAEFVIYVNMLTWPITSIGWVTSIIQRAAASQRRINEFLQTQPSIKNDEGMTPELNGDISVEGVYYKYPGKNYWALENIHFRLKKGQKIGIIGRTGSGKTTLLQLLLRIMDPQKGKIYYDRWEIREIKPSYLRSKIGYVPQDVFLFSDTIESNVLFGLDEYQSKQVSTEEALQWVDLSETIKELPAGLNSVIGERGVMLSGGQKQRLSIARAIVTKPLWLFLDDAFSAIDNDTEQKIHQNIFQRFPDTSMIITSHKVKSIMHCDYIYVMDRGKIVEEGTHQTLLEHNKLYCRFYHQQMIETVEDA